jgi:nucleoside-diphosphate-sugar epimerase
LDVSLVIGAGAVGTATARLLAGRGEPVRLVTRSGGGPEHPAIERVAADASDPDALSRLAEGVAVIYSCAGPAYPRWVTDWPPLAAALLRAAETSGALLVTTGNLYGYGAVAGPITEAMPLQPNSEKGQVRVRIWNEALDAHRAGRIRTVEVRGSDYLGAGAVTPMTLLVLPRVLAGKRAWAPADLEAPHSWTYTGDVARTLLAVAADAGSWGRAWHVPTPPPMSFREVAIRAASWPGYRLRGCPRCPTPCCGSAACSTRWPARPGRPSTSSGRRSCWTLRPPLRRSASVRHRWMTPCARRSPTYAPGHDGAAQTAIEGQSERAHHLPRASALGPRTNPADPTQGPQARPLARAARLERGHRRHPRRVSARLLLARCERAVATATATPARKDTLGCWRSTPWPPTY